MMTAEERVARHAIAAVIAAVIDTGVSEDVVRTAVDDAIAAAGWIGDFITNIPEAAA